MNDLMSRRGSSIVFLSIILSALIAIALSLVLSAREYSRFSLADGALNLAGNSVLSEYDYYVAEDYGLFLIQGTDKQLSGYLRDYSGCPARVTAGRYSTVNLEPVNRQILDYMKTAGIVDATRERAGNGSRADGVQPEGDLSDNTLPERTLRHGPTITSLPSRSIPDRSITIMAEKLAENLKNPKAIFKSGTDKFLTDSYILGKFNTDESIADSEHFYAREVEYIICGELSDEKNLKKTDLALRILRTGLNLTHIYSDKEKVAAIAAAAEIITPGVLGTVTQIGIAAAWAAAEAVNDVKLLHNGHKVPVVKDTATWAIDLDTLLGGYKAEDGCITPSVDRGRTYDDYLRILLFTKDANIKTARILDLIQINMRKNHDKNFLVQECATGISMDAEINDKSLSYDKIY